MNKCHDKSNDGLTSDNSNLKLLIIIYKLVLNL